MRKLFCDLCEQDMTENTCKHGVELDYQFLVDGEIDEKYVNIDVCGKCFEKNFKHYVDEYS